jgi:hypothetical protein
MLRTEEIDIHTRVSLACELSCIAYKHIEICFFLLSSSSHSHLCSLSSCVLMCDGGGVCILIYENRSTACARRAGARDPFLLFFFLFSILAHCSHDLFFLSICPWVRERIATFPLLRATLHSTTSILCVYVYVCL